VGVVLGVVAAYRLDHLRGLLRGVGRVQVDQRISARELAGQDREVRPDRLQVPRTRERHDAAPALRKRSYPELSSSSASSGPPSSAIRPSTNTCTKSGLI